MSLNEKDHYIHRTHLHHCIPQQNDRCLLRFPAVHGENVVFTYAGDLYTVSSSGGTARKLTNDIGIKCSHIST